MTSSAFTHRVLLGWISEFVNRPLPGAWPQIPLDDETLGDLDDYFALCQDSGYNEVVLWGGFVDRRWPLDITSCIDEDRRARLHRMLDSAHARGLKALSGLGLYSWGFDAIIEAHPHLSRTNERVMCPAVPETHEWMEKVTAFVLDNFDFDGLNMQSADNGRCDCDDCKQYSTVEYHVRLNLEVTRFIRKRWPGKILAMDNWGCPFSDPADLPHLVALSREVDYINDFNNSAETPGRAYRKELIGALACPFGTLAGGSVWPPQRWPLDKWFVPTTLINAEYVKSLYADGARGIEQFVTSLANPSGEVTLRFMGGLISHVDADPEKLLRDAIERTYAPADQATLEGLMEIVLGAERAFFGQPDDSQTLPVDLIYIDGGLLCEDVPNPEVYLHNMTPERRAAYTDTMERLGQQFEALHARIGAREKAEMTTRCFWNVVSDARRISQNHV